MKLDEVSDLIREVFGCPLKSEELGDIFISVPNPKVYDAESEGYKLCIKKAIVNESSRDCIQSIVEKRKLKMKESKGYLVIYAARKS